ncbi:transcriptional regulator [Geomonas sp. Red276]
MRQSTIQYLSPAGLEGVELLFCPDSGFNFAPHFHEAYCIWLNTDGAELYSQRGTTDILNPGSFGIVAPGDVHANRAISDSGRRLLTFYVQEAQIRPLLSETGGKSETLFNSGFYHDPECFGLLARLFSVLSTSPSVIEKESAFLEVFALLAGRHGLVRPHASYRAGDSRRIRETVRLFRDRLGESITLGEIAQGLCCTPYHLIRSFKKECGLSPHAYLLRLRLEKARELIRQGLPLVEVALQAGFADQSHLTRHFKTNYGITPGGFRQQMLGLS